VEKHMWSHALATKRRTSLAGEGDVHVEQILTLSGLSRPPWAVGNSVSVLCLHEEEKVGVEFRSRDNGIALTFRHDDWQAIKSLFRRGWQAPEVKRLALWQESIANCKNGGASHRKKDGHATSARDDSTRPVYYEYSERSEASLI
jgi:hypothetical protein